MTKLKYLGIAAALLIVVFLGFLLHADNATRVSLRLLYYQTPPVGVFWWLYAAFAFGVFVGLAFCLASRLRGRLDARRLRRVIRDREGELARLREKAAPAEETEGPSPEGG